MTELLTPRLHCTQLKQEDWSFFLALQRDPQAMLYIADSRPLSEIREAFDSRGYGYESLRALCDFAFSAGGVRRLTATVTAGNIASRNLLQKTGFLQEGELRECYWLNGRWHNDWLFGLLRRDYHTLKI